MFSIITIDLATLQVTTTDEKLEIPSIKSQDGKIILEVSRPDNEHIPIAEPGIDPWQP